MHAISSAEGFNRHGHKRSHNPAVCDARFCLIEVPNRAHALGARR